MKQSWVVFETEDKGRLLIDSESIGAICTYPDGQISVIRADASDAPQVIRAMRGFDNLANAVSCVLGYIDVTTPKVHDTAS
jgi:hypothetical protein